MKLYHAAGSGYQQGQDLVSLASQVENGWISDAELTEVLARWPDIGDDYLWADGALVSFTADLDEARAIRDEANGGKGVILCVDAEELKADGLLLKNAEGYPAVLQNVAASYLAIAE